MKRDEKYANIFSRKLWKNFQLLKLLVEWEDGSDKLIVKKRQGSDHRLIWDIIFVKIENTRKNHYKPRGCQCSAEIRLKKMTFWKI
jgi:hypothetical protein